MLWRVKPDNWLANDVLLEMPDMIRTQKILLDAKDEVMGGGNKQP